MTIGINQCTTRIARIDRGIRLNKIFKGINTEMIASEGRDNSHRHGLAHTEGIADGQHDITDLGIV